MEKRVFWFPILLAFLLVISVFVQFTPQTVAQTSSQYIAEAAFPNLTFNQPDGIFTDPANSNRLFVTEQTGTIKVFNNTPSASISGVFLDITDRVLYGGEQGLLGLAFHPNFAQNRFFYVNYVADNPRRTVIARYTVNADDPNSAEKNSEQVILEINQPYSNHKGGQLAFGPDGYLYIGVGDGGSEGDPQGNGQNCSTLLGKILRIDVNTASGGRSYAIPSDNPFVGNNTGYRDEIYAYGFRNPWRFSFDSATGALWVGDVGGDRLEEIDIVQSGRNYGWNIMEGTFCFNPPSDCNQTGLELPIWNYTHAVGNAIIGGYVYHGSALPSLDGAYIYGDYGSGRIWALNYNGTAANSLLVHSGLGITSFGLDQNGELFFCASDSKIYRLSLVIPEFTAISLTIALAATLITAVVASKRRILR